MSWESLLQPRSVDTQPASTELDKLHLRVFSTRDGKKLLQHLRNLTIEQPTWTPGEEASHGFVREGQNSLVRIIERRINRARESDD